MLLEFITSQDHNMVKYIKDDPIRSDLPIDSRFSKNRFVSIITENNKPLAITCVSFNSEVPTDIGELLQNDNDPHIAVFYTIWSYERGYGRRLLENTVRNITLEFPTIFKFVTLSPKTEMARKFHLTNGASVFRENQNSVNYEYKIKC